MTHDDPFDRPPLEAIELEMERILAEEHGLTGVRVFIDRQSGAITCSQEVPGGLKGKVFARAVKVAVSRFGRDPGVRDQG